MGTFRQIEAQHVEHVSAMAKHAQMKPNLTHAIDLLRTDHSCDLVGLFPNPDDRQPVAVVGLLYDGHKTFLTLLIVDENHRKQGIGARLVNWAIEMSKKAETRPLKIWLVASSMGNPLYRRLGFTEIGTTSLFELNGAVSIPQERHDKTRMLSSSFVEALGTRHNGKLLWTQAVEMLSDATASIPRAARLSALVQPCTAHLLYDGTDDAKPKLLAWCAVRAFTEKDRVVGPVVGLNLDDVVALMRAVPGGQEEVETNAGKSIVEQAGGSFYIHTDSQSGEEDELKSALKQMGWQHKTTQSLLECDLRKGEGDAKVSRVGRQFAMADWSQG